MSFNGSGTFSIINTFVYDTVISETEVNANFSDIATGLSTCITKDGQTTLSANIPFSGYKATGLGDGSAAADSTALHQIQDQDGIWCGTAGGSKNALTLTPTPAITAYAAGQSFTAIIGGTSSDDAVTVAVSGLATKAVQIDGSALSASVVLESGKLYRFDYDGTQFQATRLSGSFGTGDTTGPASSTDNALARFDGTGGKTLQNSGITLDDSNVLNMADNTLQRPKLLDYGETLNALGDLGGGTDDIDLTAGNVVTATVSTGEQTFTFSNPPASGTAGSFTLILTNGGSQTVNWPASVDWAGGTAPTLTASGVDVLTFLTTDGGTTWLGFLAGADMS
jgi:hypothetical protein